MVDAVIQGETRPLIVTFMECGSLIPFPTKEPITASNGVAIAIPLIWWYRRSSLVCHGNRKGTMRTWRRRLKPGLNDAGKPYRF